MPATNPDLIQTLIGAGQAGLVLVGLILFWHLHSRSETALVDRLDKIVDRHLESERQGREQIKELCESQRMQSIRVIKACVTMTETGRSQVDIIREIRDKLVGRSMAGGDVGAKA